MSRLLLRSMPLLCVIVLILSTFTHLRAEARASTESELRCTPTVIEPHQKSQCVINVRDSQQEPTMAFDVSDFSVAPYSSVEKVDVEVSTLQRGDDVTTVVFEVSASKGTVITLNVLYTSGSESSPIRNSGLVLSVMSWPAVRMGPIKCDVPAEGLALRETTTCTATLFDSDNHYAVVHESDITFFEEKKMGSFRFISGKRELVFNFTAPTSPGVTGSAFSLQVTLRDDTSNTYSAKFPLLFPKLSPVASSSTLTCNNDSIPIACTLRAADAIGPVLLNQDHFQIQMEVLQEGLNGNSLWKENTNKFDINFQHLEKTDTAVLSWRLKINNAINLQRLQVYTVPSAVGNVEKRREGVQGSPFIFVSGIMPNAAYVSLRGCRVSMINAGNRTLCYIDLHNGVTGDVRYFNLDSTLKATFENITYIPVDPVFRTPVVSFGYIAPQVVTRSEDFITLMVGGQNAMRSPFRMNVFPPRTDSEETVESIGAHNAVIIGFGLAFFGVIIGTGFFVALQRNIRMHRIRIERALRKAQMVQLEDQEGPSMGGQVSIDVLEHKNQEKDQQQQQQQQHSQQQIYHESESD
ncbi:uncharacterized protein TM35_000083660 [Trypanosoma theileri]|uniref:Uncharacterized protein n=1 Tax=Trypanosoma theileri TaxID=67003 RepID=A0A1X0P168_9TRYP|nr:uncharacterized protein TM35_000083660 [Trypanosoma theileri]ORC90568.1 hypothetical protein TM35_000083660 [Trypanosoma theileri]